MSEHKRAAPRAPRRRWSKKAPSSKALALVGLPHRGERADRGAKVTAPALAVSESGAVHGRIKVGELISPREQVPRGEPRRRRRSALGHDQGQHDHPREVARGEALGEKRQDAGHLRRVSARGGERGGTGRARREALGTAGAQDQPAAAAEDRERPAERRLERLSQRAALDVIRRSAAGGGAGLTRSRSACPLPRTIALPSAGKRGREGGQVGERAVHAELGRRRCGLVAASRRSASGR